MITLRELAEFLEDEDSPIMKGLMDDVGSIEALDPTDPHTQFVMGALVTFLLDVAMPSSREELVKILKVSITMMMAGVNLGAAIHKRKLQREEIV